MNFEGMDLGVFDIEEPEKALDANKIFTVEETNVGVVIMPDRCEIVGFQWAPPADGKNDKVHLYVYVRRRGTVTGVVLWPTNC